ncbi:MAG: DUF1194 domain-containing protein [Geminicoccaceae bacterium]
MRTWLRAVLVAGAAAAWGEARAEVAVDLELVLAVDVSGSMDPEEHEIQRSGYVAALTHPDVVGAIRSGSYGRVAIAYVEWAGPFSQALTVPWRMVEDQASAEALAAELAGAPYARIRGTSISGGLMFAAGLFDGNGYEGFRRVIDVSGDGPNNMGAPVVPSRDAVVERGIVINGLPILVRPSGGFGTIPELDIYYEDCVIGGPGAFVLPVRNLADITESIRRKLVLEIAGPEPTVTLAATRAPRIDCMIGEQQRRTWMDR